MSADADTEEHSTAALPAALARLQEVCAAHAMCGCAAVTAWGGAGMDVRAAVS